MHIRLLFVFAFATIASSDIIGGFHPFAIGDSLEFTRRERKIYQHKLTDTAATTIKKSVLDIRQNGDRTIYTFACEEKGFHITFSENGNSDTTIIHTTSNEDYNLLNDTALFMSYFFPFKDSFSQQDLNAFNKKYSVRGAGAIDYAGKKRNYLDCLKLTAGPGPGGAVAGFMFVYLAGFGGVSCDTFCNYAIMGNWHSKIYKLSRYNKTPINTDSIIFLIKQQTPIHSSIFKPLFWSPTINGLYQLKKLLVEYSDRHFYIEIYAVNGKLFLSTTTACLAQKCFQSLPKGVYVFKGTCGSQTFCFKEIIHR